MAKGGGSGRQKALSREASVETNILPLEEKIRQRAHEIWLAHGGGASELEDWLQAEKEIRTEKAV